VLRFEEYERHENFGPFYRYVIPEDPDAIIKEYLNKTDQTNHDLAEDLQNLRQTHLVR
jgi:hypothetical protein